MKLQIVIFFALISLSTCIDEKELAFIKIGTYKGLDNVGKEYKKSFYVTRDFKVNWIVARTVCFSYGMDLARLETKAEFDAVQEMVDKFWSDFEEHTLIDGITLKPGSRTDWYFSNGKKFPQPMKWNAGEPSGNSERCLNLVKSHGGISFNDLPCCLNPNPNYENLKFVCQEYDFLS